MDGLVVITILVFGGFLFALRKKAQQEEGTGAMSDKPITIDNIRRGVANGWYSAQLIRVAGQPAVRLTGTTVNDEEYIDIYPIDEADWQTLKAEGYSVDV